MTKLKYTPQEAAKLREDMLRDNVIPNAKRVFARVPELKSAYLMVAQYWNDEADDAVHCAMIYSQLHEPDLAAYEEADASDEPDFVNLPAGTDKCKIEGDDWVGWDDNGEAIPAFAAFCKEDSHQEMSTAEAYAPYAILRKRNEEVECEVVGKMLRPWLDGVCPDRDSTSPSD